VLLVLWTASTLNVFFLTTTSVRTYNNAQCRSLVCDSTPFDACMPRVQLRRLPSEQAQFYRVQCGDAPLVIVFALFSCAMVATRAGKRAAADASNPLNDAGILKQVLSYAGAGEFIFYAPISKLWLECYRAVPAHEMKKDDTIRQEQDLDVLPQMTLRRAVFASAARVKLAHQLGLQFGTECLQLHFYLGLLACKAVLTEAHRLGMPVSASTLNGAAFSGELSAVIWLHTEHSCALNHNTILCCARTGQIEVLRWLKQQGMVFTTDAMNFAAMHGQNLTCAYLHAEGCTWDELASFAAAHKKHWNTVRWLYNHGCPWYFSSMCLLAAEQGSIDGMAYILQQQLVTVDAFTRMLNIAGCNDRLAAAQWLRQQHYAEWPPVLCYDDKPWSGDTLEWARAEGCDSPLDEPLQDDIDDIDDVDEL
jgi:hypothetical protein